MGFTDSLKKVIGIEDIDDEEIVTDEELNAAKEKLARESKRERAAERETQFVPFAMNKEEKLRDEKPQAYPSRSEKRFSVTGTNSLKLILIEPKNFDECPKLVDSLKSRKPVIINLEKLETEIARKIFDFLSGATYALNGNVQKIANNIFIFTPENVSVASEQSREPAPDRDDRNPWR